MTSQGTINDVVPTDLMCEIFFRCLPWDPLKYEQPDVRIAPMLLCHVCSQWRAIAFQTPLLWTQLYHVANLQKRVGIFNPRDISFLHWWRERVQDVSPSLRLAFKDPEDDSDDSDEEYDASGSDVDSGDFISFLVKFLSNARYLSLDIHYNYLLWALNGERSLSCANLHTLVIRHGLRDRLKSIHWQDSSADSEEARLNEEKYVPVNSQQGGIRRLAIENLVITTPDFATVLNFADITHLNLAIFISFEGWFSLLRESVNLVYGSFNVTFNGEVNNYTPQAKILPHLRQMTFENYGMDLKQSFLDGLQLPSLTGLRVDHHIPLSVDRLHRVLESTPSLRILQLGPIPWPSDEDLAHSVFVPGDLSPGLIPLSSIVPKLESIHFEGTTSMIDIFAPENRELVISVLNGDWLQLGKPGSSLSRIYFGSHWDDGNVEWNEIVNLVDNLQESMPTGVELAVRPYDAPRLWLSHWKDGDFTDEFEDLRFED